MTFTRNEVRGDTFSFSKEEISSKNLRVVGLLGEKFTFFNSLGTTKISRILRLSVNINIVLLIKFLEHFELCFYLKYSRSYKVL